MTEAGDHYCHCADAPVPHRHPRPIEGAPATPLLCVGCYAEQLAGQRAEANPAILVVGGTSTCAEHLTIQQGPAIPGRTPSGIILGGG
jgi:hypothetical protein